MSRWTPTSRPRCGEPWEPGRRFDTETLRRAGAGEVVSKGEEVATGSREGPRGTNEALEVYVPLTYGLDHPVGIAESYLPYAPVAAAIAHDKLVLSSALGLTLLVFWLVTARMVSQASRRLRVTASRNDYLARHDVLTGLPNRAYLLEQLEDALATAAPTGSTVAVLLVTSTASRRSTTPWATRPVTSCSSRWAGGSVTSWSGSGSPDRAASPASGRRVRGPAA